MFSSGWADFYVIVGGGAAALTGLQFVVMVLSADVGMGTSETTSAFATPTIVHFCAVLLIAAVMTAPWPSPLGAAIVLAAAGVVGAVYTISVLRTAKRQSAYQPVFEDWLTHFILPLVGYLALVVGGVLLERAGAAARFTIAGTTVVLLFDAIHNAWDSVTYIAHQSRMQKRRGDGSGDEH